MTKQQDVLVDRYELTDRIGLGGMAEVYLGRDRVLDRTVAVKTLLTQFAHDPSFIARFKREATSAAQLNHPNIVGVYDTGADDGRQFIVMEYIEGKTLKDLIREEGPLLPERAAEIAAEVCSALQFAHAHGIVHRDVKPANIMLSARGEVKVADFGIARAASGDTVTQTATVLGTAQYFSPEQAQAAPVDARSDLYSLGVVLYEMLTRQAPFSGASPVAIAYKHVKEDPIPPTRLNADIPAALEAIVMRAMSKNPDNRYQSAQDMRQDLERALRGLPVNAPRIMTPADQTAVMTGVGANDQTVVMRGQRTGRPAPPASNKRGVGIALLALITLGMIGIIIWALISLLPSAPQLVRVPEVTGFTVEDARKAITERDLRVQIGPAEPSTEVAPGKVIRSNPSAGKAVAKNSTVTLIPSGGRKKLKVPSVVGSDRTTAEARLEALNLVVSIISRPDNTKPAGQVLEQNPPANTEVEEGSTVTLTVSSGKEQATIPNVVGKTEGEARSELTSRKFKVRVIYQAPGSDCPQVSGRVCSQSPQAGESASVGSEVVIIVAKEDEPTAEPTPTGIGTSSPSP